MILSMATPTRKAEIVLRFLQLSYILHRRERISLFDFQSLARSTFDTSVISQKFQGIKQTLHARLTIVWKT
jgi:hypothetical protein